MNCRFWSNYTQFFAEDEEKKDFPAFAVEVPDNTVTLPVDSKLGINESCRNLMNSKINNNTANTKQALGKNRKYQI